MFQGTLDELKQKQQQSVSVIFETSDAERRAEVLAGHHADLGYIDGKFRCRRCRGKRSLRSTASLVAAGVEVFEIHVMRNDLERIFIDMVSN